MGGCGGGGGEFAPRKVGLPYAVTAEDMPSRPAVNFMQLKHMHERQGLLAGQVDEQQHMLCYCCYAVSGCQ